MSGMNSYCHLLPPFYKDEIHRWIHEDCPTIDVGGFVVGEKLETAHLLCKSSGVLSGVPFAQAVFEYLDLETEWKVEEGTFIDCSQSPNGRALTAIVKGKCRNILLAERTALNILTRASGVATEARNCVNIAALYNWKGFVAGTRKTTPGFKFVEKYSLLVGGVTTHRHDLSDMVMLKDNHVWSAGSITAAVKKAKIAAGFSQKIEVRPIRSHWI